MVLYSPCRTKAIGASLVRHSIRVSMEQLMLPGFELLQAEAEDHEPTCCECGENIAHKYDDVLNTFPWCFQCYMNKK